MNFSNRTKRFILNSLLYLAVSVALLGGLALTASAQTQLAQAISSDYGLEATANAAGLPVGDLNPIDIAATIVNLVLGFLGVLLVVLIVYAGFMWMTAAGDEQKITKAKALLGNAVIGMAIVLAAFAITAFTTNTIQRATGVAFPSSGEGSCPACPPDPNPSACPAGQTRQCVCGSWGCY